MGNTPCCEQVNIQHSDKDKEENVVITNKFTGYPESVKNGFIQQNKVIPPSSPKQANDAEIQKNEIIPAQSLQSDEMSYLERKYNILPPFQKQSEKISHQQLEKKESPQQKDNIHQKQAEKEVILIPKLSFNVQQVIEDLHKKGLFGFFDSKTSFNTSIRKYGQDIYEGELNDQKTKPEGLGKMYKSNNSLYIGNFHFGEAEGQGIFIHADGSYYHGHFNRNKADSTKGQFITKNFEYIGGFKNNIFEGHGKQKGPNHQFEGQYANGKKIRGVLKWNQNKFQFVYEGAFNEENEFQGKGKLKEPQGKYQGEFVKGKKQGKGAYMYSNGLKYDGSYKNGVKQGEGIIYNDDGTISYEGSFHEGLPHGKGIPYNGPQQGSIHNWIEGIDELNLPSIK